MTTDEQKQLDHLREQLDNANRDVESVRAFFSSALQRSNDEARLYRGLFWCLLALATIVAILRLVQR